MEGTAGVSGRRIADESLLDDPEALAEHDPGGMLRLHRLGRRPGAGVAPRWPPRPNLALLDDEGRPGRS